MCIASLSFLANCFGCRTSHPRSEVHEYIHHVLETGEHGPCHHILCDLPTLNDTIQQHAERIGIAAYIIIWGHILKHNRYQLNKSAMKSKRSLLKIDSDQTNPTLPSITI